MVSKTAIRASSSVIGDQRRRYGGAARSQGGCVGRADRKGACDVMGASTIVGSRGASAFLVLRGGDARVLSRRCVRMHGGGGWRWVKSV